MQSAGNVDVVSIAQSPPQRAHPPQCADAASLTIDALGETLGFAFEAGLLMESSRQSVVGRRLAGWAGILAVPTAIAGIYGMNFEYMPELKWRYGYFLALGVVAAVCGYLFLRFRRAGWI